MGLIKSIVNAASGTLGDQYVDFITCDSMSDSVLLAPGRRPNQRLSSNNNFNENIITNGSKINIADGQGMLICENGKIVDFSVVSGQYTYDSAIQPSLLGGGLKDLGKTFEQIGKRFVAGGAPTDEQRVYYVNMKEILNNKIGGGRIPFRDSEFQFTVFVQAFGQYTFKIVNPMLFYKNLVGNVTGEYRKDTLLSQMKTELISALNPALAKIAAKKISYDQLPMFPTEIGEALNDELSVKWGERMGIDIISVAFESVTVDEASAKKIEQFQEARVFGQSAAMAAGRLTAAQSEAMIGAANNENGAMQAFMGMGMAQNASSSNISGLFGMGQQPSQVPPPIAPPSPTPAPAQDSWTCKDGHANKEGLFCAQCGVKKDDSWACECGNSTNIGNFCSKCGKPKPTTRKTFKCNKCGWTPPVDAVDVKFCPQCGDIFDENDIEN